MKQFINSFVHDSDVTLFLKLVVLLIIVGVKVSTPILLICILLSATRIYFYFDDKDNKDADTWRKGSAIDGEF